MRTSAPIQCYLEHSQEEKGFWIPQHFSHLHGTSNEASYCTYIDPPLQVLLSIFQIHSRLMLPLNSKCDLAYNIGTEDACLATNKYQHSERKALCMRRHLLHCVLWVIRQSETVRRAIFMHGTHHQCSPKLERHEFVRLCLSVDTFDYL